jgi:hypothetical protein
MITNASMGFEMLYVIALSFGEPIGAKLLQLQRRDMDAARDCALCSASWRPHGGDHFDLRSAHFDPHCQFVVYLPACVRRLSVVLGGDNERARMVG